jgi:hypothetical protein
VEIIWRQDFCIDSADKFVNTNPVERQDTLDAGVRVYESTFSVDFFHDVYYEVMKDSIIIHVAYLGDIAHMFFSTSPCYEKFTFRSCQDVSCGVAVKIRQVTVVTSRDVQEVPFIRPWLREVEPCCFREFHLSKPFHV